MIDPTQQQQPAADPTQPGPAGPVPQTEPAAAVPPSPLASMPAGLGLAPRQPNVPPPSLPHITPDTPDEHLPQEPRLDELKNTFDRRGLLLAQAVEDMGQRIANATQEPPTNSKKLEPEQMRDYWRYSPVASTEAEANTHFWQVHDQVLAQTGDAAQAEQQALQKVFPYRSTMVGSGISSAERQVELAEHIRGVVDGEVKPPSEVVAIQHHAMNDGVTGGGY